MDDKNDTIIYGLESQARALAPQLGEHKEIRFFIATQSLKPANNQLHLIEINSDYTSMNTKIFLHPMGEVWKLNSSPHDAQLLVSCFGTQKGSQVIMQSALITLPEDLNNNNDEAGNNNNDDDDGKEFLQFKNCEILVTDGHGTDIKTTEFHPIDKNLLATVIDRKILLHERTPTQTRIITEITGKNSSKFTTGKWSQHHSGNQFIALYDTSIRSYDIRDPKHIAWQIEDAHGQSIRDLDCNPNRQCHLVTGGDDGTLKIWDSRNVKESLFSRNDHSHWIWSVRFNTFHDQLILSSSSDCKVLLTCAGSVSSESGGNNDRGTGNDNNDDDCGDGDGNGNGKTEHRERLPDGLLQCFEQHEDSVYCVQWSNVDPWIFASLSYDGRLIVTKVPRQYKYQILL